MLKRCSLLAALLCVAVVASAQVYRWVDENGVVHYSDQPVPGAERVDIQSRPGAAGSRPAPAPRSARPAGSRPARQPPPSQPFSYESLAFSEPTAEQTLWNIGGVLNVAVTVRPALRDSDRLRIYFDGEPREVNSQRIQLQEVWRGAHNLQAEIVDADGELMIRSDPLRFYVQQTSILNP